MENKMKKKQDLQLVTQPSLPFEGDLSFPSQLQHMKCITLRDKHLKKLITK